MEKKTEFSLRPHHARITHINRKWCGTTLAYKGAKHAYDVMGTKGVQYQYLMERRKEVVVAVENGSQPQIAPMGGW